MYHPKNPCKQTKIKIMPYLLTTHKPFLIANSDNDPVTGNNPRLVEILKRIPTAQEIIIKGPGHFLQEEAGPEYAKLIIDFIDGNPKGFTMEQKVLNREDIL